MQEQEEEQYRQWGSCDLEPNVHTERELFVCSECDREVCMECIADVKRWLCVLCQKAHKRVQTIKVS